MPGGPARGSAGQSGAEGRTLGAPPRNGDESGIRDDLPGARLPTVPQAPPALASAPRRRSTLGRILSYLRPVWGLVVIALALTLVGSGLNQVPQLANRYLIDHVLAPKAGQGLADPLRVLAEIAIGLFALRLVNSGLSFLRSYSTRIVGQRMIYGLRRDIFRRVQYLSSEFYIQTGVGQIMSRVMNDTGTVQSFVTGNLSQMLEQLFTFAVSFGLLQHYDPRLTYTLLLFGPPIAGSILLFSGRLKATNRAIRRQTARLTAAVHDALSGFITVKAFAAEEHVIGAFESENVDLFSKNLTLMRLQAAFSNTMGLITGSSAAFFILYGGWQVLRYDHHLAGGVSLGTYFLVNGMRANLFLPFTSFANITATYQQASAGAERIFEYLDIEPTVRDRPDAVDLPPARGAIEFRDVTFHYPRDPAPQEPGSLGRDRHGTEAVPVSLVRRPAEASPIPGRAGGRVRAAAPFRSAAARVRGVLRWGRSQEAGGDPEIPGPSPADAPGEAVAVPPVAIELEAPEPEDLDEDAPPPAALRGVSFAIAPGETVGLVGPSGGGKSTVASLIARFYDCDEGAVLIDGHDIRAVTLRSLRSQLAVVLQDVYLFRATVRDNVAFGLQNVTDAEIDDALRAANAHFVWELPEGPDSLVGEGGLLLSGGQRQRVAIARALLRHPRILILDEATSAQDTLSENAVMDALRVRAGEMTVVVIAHRLSTITHADRILVLQDGAVVQEGRHEELLARGGLYAALYGAQVGVEAGEGAPGG